MKRFMVLIGLVAFSIQGYTNNLSASKEEIRQWLEKTDMGLNGNIVKLEQVTLESGESAYLVKLDGPQTNYALARPKVKAAEYLDDLSDDLYRAYNLNDIELIPTKDSTVLVLEGGSSHQGYFGSSRKFITFNGWEVDLLHSSDMELDNSAACGDGVMCEIVTTTYKIITESPLVISETTTMTTGANYKSMGKPTTTNRIVNLQEKVHKAQEPVAPLEDKTADIMDFDIVGVKLGMTEQEVIKAIESSWGLTKEEMNIKHPIMSIDAQVIASKAKQRIVVDLNTPRVGEDRETPIVDRIVYDMVESPENEQAILERALEKYGKPTNYDGTAYVWCQIKPFSGCNTDTSAGLSLIGTRMAFFGPTHETEIRERMSKPENPKPDF